MSTVTTHERPGVYSVYEASSLVSGGSGGKAAGIAAVSTGGVAGTLYSFSKYEDAVSALGKDDHLTGLVKLLFQNGAARVLAVPVTAPAGYGDAFALLNAQDGIGVLTCDSTELTVQQALRDGVSAASQARKERIAVVGGGAGESAGALVTRAAGLNSERVVLAAPAGTGEPAGALAAALAGTLCAQTDPAVPLGGAALAGLTGVRSAFAESELDTLLRGGVTPVECLAGTVTVLRGVTTRTTTGGSADNTWRELSTILVVDHVIPAVRSTLAARFTRAKNTAQVRSAIRSQVILELEETLAAEIITGYGGVTVSQVADNPTVCLVEFSFTVAHGLNQIWLSAKITV